MKQSAIAPSWKPKKPKFFDSGKIGGEYSATIDSEIQLEIVDSVTWFSSNERNQKLNVKESVSATLRNAGALSLIFHTQKHLKSVFILEDGYSQTFALNNISVELEDCLAASGLNIVRCSFYGSLETFFTSEGQAYNIEYMDSQKLNSLFLIFSDGASFRNQRNRNLLDTISSWPQVVWMEQREYIFWDEFTLLPLKHRIPAFPATDFGLLDAFCLFNSNSTNRQEITEYNIGANLNSVLFSTSNLPKIEFFLGEVILWAADCTLIQPVTLGLAEAIRLEFHPKISKDKIQRICKLPQTIFSTSGMKFSKEIMIFLRRELLNRRTEKEIMAVHKFISNEIKKVEPKEDEDSLAYLSWEAIYQRVQLEVSQVDALKRLEELSLSPLGGYIESSLDNFGFTDDKDLIPLVKKNNNIQNIKLIMSTKNSQKNRRKRLRLQIEIGLWVYILIYLISNL